LGNLRRAEKTEQGVNFMKSTIGLDEAKTIIHSIKLTLDDHELPVSQMVVYDHPTFDDPHISMSINEISISDFDVLWLAKLKNRYGDKIYFDISSAENAKTDMTNVVVVFRVWFDPNRCE